MKISHQGMFNGGGTPFALAAALVIAVATQANFTHYKKLGKRTATQGEIDLCGAGDVAVGVFVDVSPQGNSCTIETEGYEWVKGYAGVAVGDIVTPDAAGILKKATEPAGAAVTLAEATTMLAERTAGLWQVDQVNGTEALINLSARL